MVPHASLMGMDARGAPSIALRFPAHRHVVLWQGFLSAVAFITQRCFEHSKVDALGSTLHLCTDGPAATAYVLPYTAVCLGAVGLCLGFAVPKDTAMVDSGHLLGVGGRPPSFL